MNIFWPHHLKNQGNVSANITLENFTARYMKQFFLSNRLGIKSLSPKVTIIHQPNYMRIIASLKVWYKALYLQKLLEILYTPGGFERVAISRKIQRRGCRGI